MGSWYNQNGNELTILPIRHPELDISSCRRACEAYKGGCRQGQSGSIQYTKLERC